MLTSCLAKWAKQQAPFIFVKSQTNWNVISFFCFQPCKDWQLPPCVGNDRQWHTVFAVCVILMLISMVNLVVFGEDEGRNKSRSSIANAPEFATIRVSMNSNDPFVTKARQTFMDNLFVKNNSSTLYSTPTTTTNTFYILSTNGTVNATQLWQNLSAAIPSLQNMNLIPNRSQQKPTNGKKPPPEPEKTLHIVHHQQQHAFRGEHSYRRRKNFPTKPSEVILVISGCLFFITFFMATFAQIKSQVSFYTMMVRFIHWNQQWIIEEYNPDDTSDQFSSSDALSSSPITVKTSSNADLSERQRKQVIDLWRSILIAFFSPSPLPSSPLYILWTTKKSPIQLESMQLGIVFRFLKQKTKFAFDFSKNQFQVKKKSSFLFEHFLKYCFLFLDPLINQSHYTFNLIKTLLRFVYTLSLPL